MPIELGPNQYGKAETRVVRLYRDGERHEIRDLNVSTLLRGDFADAYARGDQASVLPTDSQKNACFALAKEKGVGEIEDYALDLARHFVSDIGPVAAARVEVDEYRWERIAVAGQPHPHTFTRASHNVRTTAVTVTGAEIVGGAGWRPATMSMRSGCPRPTSITSWPTCRRSGWTIPVRCSTPPTARTA